MKSSRLTESLLVADSSGNDTVESSDSRIMTFYYK